MNFISFAKLLSEYVTIYLDGYVQIHHVKCTKATTLVSQWKGPFPGGMPFTSQVDEILKHSEIVHGIHVD